MLQLPADGSNGTVKNEAIRRAAKSLLLNELCSKTVFCSQSGALRETETSSCI
jgi:hypothetical protein